MTNKSRNGKHKEGNVLLGAMVEPEKKAIAIVTAAVLAKEGKPMTQTDVIWDGVCSIAHHAGVVDANGRPTPQYKDAVMLATASVVFTNKSNRGTRGGKRKAK